MATFTNAAWGDKMMRATPEDRRKLAQDLTKGVHSVTDGTGRVLDFTPPPDRLGPSPLPPFPVRDRGGNIVQEAAPAKADAVPVTKSFSLGDRAAFESCIADEPPFNKVELRLWFDQQRKENGID